MPESGEVVLMTQRLSENFPIGSLIVSIEGLDPTFKPISILSSDFPLHVKELSSKGKKTYIKTESGICLLISYGMTGSWTKKRTEFSKYCFVGENNLKYYWQCKRKLNTETVELLTEKELKVKLDKLGFDIYYDYPSSEQIISSYPPRGRNICSFLLNCKFAGIGNYIKSMILYQLRISPYKNTKELNREQKLAIFNTAKEIAHCVVNHGGHTVKDFHLDDGKELKEFDTIPYGKKKDKEGNEIKCEMIGGRVTYWVPLLQK